MPNHENGDKSLEHLIGSISTPKLDNQQPSWQKAYSSIEHYVPQNKATAGIGDGDLFAPPIEFAGVFNSNGFSNIGDPFSSSYRSGNAFGYYDNGLNKDGWRYGGGRPNIDHLRIAQSRILYKTEGIVQTIVHLLADFVVENVDLVHPDLTVHSFYKSWQTKIGLKDRLHRFVVDLLTTGNVFVWSRLAKLKSSEKQAMKRGYAAELIGNELVLKIDHNGKYLKDKTISVEVEPGILNDLKDLGSECIKHAQAGHVNMVKIDADSRNDPANPEVQNDTVEIPWDYISLNPLQIEPRGSRFANEHYWVMLIHKRDMQPLSKFMSYKYYNDVNITKINLPEFFKGKIRPLAKPNGNYVAELVLDTKKLSVIQDVTKADYEDWATPQIFPAYKEIQFKRMMRNGEISAIESLKHMITLIKLGDTKEGFIPTREQMERVATALAGGSQTHHLVWDDLIKGEVLQPDIAGILDPKKYEQIDKDIYAALGISESVFSGGASYANSFMSIKLLLEKLETIREKLNGWLRVEIKKVADAMKFKRLPIIQWGLMNLRDENAERKLWLDLYDRGIVSDQSLLERFGSDFEIEVERQKIERSIKEEENPDLLKEDKKFRAPVMVSKGPFNQSKQISKNNGRPIKTGKPQEKQRNTKPKGMASIIKYNEILAYANDSLKTIVDTITEYSVKENNIKDSRQLSKAQKQTIEELSINILSSLDPSKDKINRDLVYLMLDDPTNIKSNQEICDLFKSEAEQVSTKEDRLNLMSTVFAAVYSNIIEE